MLEKRNSMNNTESNNRIKHANVAQHINRRRKLKDSLLKVFPFYYENGKCSENLVSDVLMDINSIITN